MRTQTFTQHLQAFMDIYKHFKRQSLGHCHDVLLKTRRLSRKNIKENEEDIIRLVSQILTRSHKCRYFRILKPVQLEENKCLHSPLNKTCCRYLNLTTQKTNALGDALPSLGVNPLEGSPKCSCGKLGLGRRSRLPTLERGRGLSWEPRD
jgi:hypothetical protein